MIARTDHPAVLNSIANHPAVRPWMGGDGPVDLTAIVTDPMNVVLATEEGGFIARNLHDGRYEVHALFDPAARHQHAVRAMRIALRVMFTQTDAVELYAAIPYRNRAARALARIAGFEPRLCYLMPWTGESLMQTEMSVLSITTWMARERAKGH